MSPLKAVAACLIANAESPMPGSGVPWLPLAFATAWASAADPRRTCRTVLPSGPLNSACQMGIGTGGIARYVHGAPTARLTSLTGTSASIGGRSASGPAPDIMAPRSVPGRPPAAAGARWAGTPIACAMSASVLSSAGATCVCGRGRARGR
ncbi:hypothetical protein ACFQX7_34660 [Luedemannella flava]